jgi:FkbM family methyltransferase
MSFNLPNKVLTVFKKVSTFFQSSNPDVSLLRKTFIFFFSLPFCLLAIMYINLFRSRIYSFPIDIRMGRSFKLNFVSMDTIACYLYLFEVWEPDCTAYICKNLKPGKTFIDVGANIGYYSLLASQLVGDKGRVISIEASSKISAVLQGNVHLNALASNIEVHNLAIADKPGKVAVHLGPDGNLGATTTANAPQNKFPYRKFNLEGQVDAVTLDELIGSEDLENLQMIKIDVEGTERDVIAGMVEIIKDGPPELEILIELTPLWWSKPKPSLEEVLDPFFEQGYKAYIIPNSYLPWRYLWPSMVEPPRKTIGPIKSMLGQVDIVLSKRDLEYLS